MEYGVEFIESGQKRYQKHGFKDCDFNSFHLIYVKIISLAKGEFLKIFCI